MYWADFLYLFGELLVGLISFLVIISFRKNRKSRKSKE